MADYKYTQQSGTKWKVNTSNKADSTEDCNELRAIADELGRLLGHSLKDGSFPEDLASGGTLDYVKKSNFSSTGNPAVSDDSTEGYAVGSRWINTATDKEYICLDSSSGAAVWEETTLDSFLDLDDTPSDFEGDASKILTVTTGETAVEFTSSTGINHNDFGGLDSGDYQHLTQAEHDEITQWAGAVTLSTGGAINLVTFSTGGTVNIPTGQEYQINGTALAASDVGALYSSGAFTVGRLTEISTTGGVIKASPFAVTTGDVFDFGAHSAGFTEQAITTTTGTRAINWNSGNKALFTRSTGSAGAVTFTFTAPVKSGNLMLIIRGSTAGSTGTITWPTVYWQGGAVPTLTSGASAIDVVSFYYSTGLTAYLGLGSVNFSTV